MDSFNPSRCIWTLRENYSRLIAIVIFDPSHIYASNSVTWGWNEFRYVRRY